MKQAKKIAACSMAATMIISSVMASGCSKKPKGSNEKIAEDAPWYNLEVVRLGEQYKDDDTIEYIYTDFIGQSDDLLVYYTNGSRHIPDDVDYSTLDYTEYEISNIDVYGTDGSFISSIDVNQAISDSGVYDYTPPTDAEGGSDADTESEGDAADDHAPATAVGAPVTPKTAGNDEDSEESDADVADAADSQDDSDMTDVPDDELIPDDAVLPDDVVIDAWADDYVPSAYWYVNSYNVKNGQAEITVAGGVPSDDGYGMDEINTVFTFDLSTGTLISTEDATLEDSGEEMYTEGTTFFEGYSVSKTWVPGDTGNSSYILDVTSPDGTETTYDLREILPEEDIYNIEGILYMGDDKFLFAYYGSSYDSVTTYVVDMTSGQIEEYDGDTAWFDSNLYGVSYITGIGNVIIDQTGIKKLDFDSQSRVELFNFESCNINRADAQSLSLVSMTDDKIVLSGTLYRGNGYYYDGTDIDTELFILDRADTNPHAGKTVLVAATLGGFDYTLCEAVCNYNDSNSDYFIRLDSKYSLMDKYYSGEIDWSAEDADEQALEAESELSNQLMIDLLAGEGPDLILDGAEYYQLNNEDYLIDLSEEIDTTGLFTNVIEASKVEDKLYQIPLTIGVEGILAHKSDVDDDQYGFTFDQYSDFVSGPCNGTDPMSMDQMDFFMSCLNSINSECMTDGKASYDNDQFRALAGYVNDNVADQLQDDEGNVYYSGMDLEEQGAAYESYLSFTYLINMYSENISDLRVLGVPSSDGRGPVIDVNGSVAVSAQTNEKDACVAFVNTLLSEDIQNDYGKYDYCTPIRISSFEASAGDAIDNYNKMVEDTLRWASEEDIIMYNLQTETLDDSAIAEFETMVESCTQISSMDPAVAAIVREEMGAYFSGQKSLDDVITVMEDRVQTFINERG